MKIFYTSKFFREYKKLTQDIKLLAEKKELLFRKAPHHPSLETHKLHGAFREFWSFSLNSKNRIIFEFGENGEVYFHSVGDHGIYK